MPASEVAVWPGATGGVPASEVAVWPGATGAVPANEAAVRPGSTGAVPANEVVVRPVGVGRERRAPPGGVDGLVGPLPGGVPGAAAIAEEAGALVTITFTFAAVGAIGWPVAAA